MAVAVENLYTRRLFNIGWDMGFYDMTPDAEHPSEVHIGWRAAQERAINKKRADRFVRKWLQLRLGAFNRGKYFARDVTPEYLRSIDVTHCPILRERLTHGGDPRLNWSIDRVNNRLGYGQTLRQALGVKASARLNSKRMTVLAFNGERST